MNHKPYFLPMTLTILESQGNLGLSILPNISLVYYNNAVSCIILGLIY